jgi:hypothetical protein
MTAENSKKWLVNVVVDNESLMLAFDNQKEQLAFVKKIKKSVDNCVYALNPVELVSEETLKSKINK